MTVCLACGAEQVRMSFFEKTRVPVLNNVVHASPEAGSATPTGTVRLALCPVCGFCFNTAYDPEIIKYTEDYDAARSHSAVFRSYLESMVRRLTGIVCKNDRVLEIGCGDGNFLLALNAATGAKCDGYDRSCPTRSPVANVRFLRCHFGPEESVRNGPYDILVLRHVLEHLPQPYTFLRMLLDSGTLRVGGRVVFEVPDFEWILKNRTFFDITYEHCNYFSGASLSRLIRRLGWHDVRIDHAFGGQYLLATARWDGPGAAATAYSTPIDADSLMTAIEGLATERTAWIEKCSAWGRFVIWGASGKGVIFLNDLGEGVWPKVAAVIDSNPTKQNKFVPGTGHLISSPSILKQNNICTNIVVMNTVYKREILEQIKSLGISGNVECF